MPEPTSPATTSGVRFVNKDVLFPRQGASSLGTCAYEKGDPTSPLTCEAGDVCAWETGSATSTFWGPNCCPSTASDCSAYALTSCIDYASHDLHDNNATVISRELYCGTGYEYCGTMYMPVTSPSTFSALFTRFFCGTTESSTLSAFLTPVSGSTEMYAGASTSSKTTDQSTIDPIDSPPQATSSTLVTSSTTQSPSSPGPTDPTVDASENTAEPKTGESHTAAIAGGVGGGVGGVLAIAGIIGYLVYRKKKQRKEKVPEIST
ncbi:hypothetical protein Q7P36_007887 [Cladosporium allicinum]